MSTVFAILLIVAFAGFLALRQISGDLARRSRLAGPARVLLAAALGTGVIAVSIKVVLVGALMTATAGDRERPPPGPPRDGEILSTSYLGSSVTDGWHALPAVAPTPDGRPLRPEVVRLGRRLFNEPGLSADGEVACRSCHKLGAGGDDDAAVATGIGGAQGARNAPTVWNAAFLSRLFWDGRASSLEAQAKGPLTNPIEMGMPSHDAVEAAVRNLPGYGAAFAAAFGSADAVSIDNIAFALASYERTLIASDSDYDRFVRGEVGALTPRQVRGMALFAGLGCRGCHRDPTFSAAGTTRPAGVRRPFPIFRDHGFVREYDLLADPGAARGHGSGMWRVPSLRNVANTAPYFHNGSVASLAEAVRVMAAVQIGWRVATGPGDETPDIAPEIAWNPATRRVTPYRPAVLSDQDIAALVAFLESLSVEVDGDEPGVR